MVGVRCRNCGATLSGAEVDAAVASYPPKITLWGFLLYLVRGHRPPTAARFFNRRRHPCGQCRANAWEDVEVE